MSKHDAMDEVLALPRVVGRNGWSLAMLLALLLAVSTGLARPAAASEMPKISTPQVRVNTGVHVNAVNAHPTVGTNSGVRNVHQFDKNNGGNKGGGNKNAGSTTPKESVQFNYNAIQYHYTPQ